MQVLHTADGTSFAAVRAFLSGEGVDHSGRTLADILAWTDRQLSMSHDFIQWLFPLPEPSQFNPKAPVPTLKDFELLARDQAVRHGTLRALDRMLQFYGFELGAQSIRRGPAWDAKARNWVHAHTHNDLRITRILRSLRLLGMAEESGIALAAFETAAREYRGPKAERPVMFWRGAVHG